jgi:Flp pilus assembly protein TadG
VIRSPIVDRLRRGLQWLAGESRGSQIVEFAVALPLLLVLVVGICDFGNAFNMKQKLTNAAREAARLGSSQSTADLTQGSPASVVAIRDLVSYYLQTARMNDCGIGTSAATAVGASSPWAWSFTATCPNGGTFTLTVDRGNVFASSVTTGGNTIKVISTNVTISYPYKWQFNRVIGLLVSGASYPAATNIVVNSTMENQT